MQKNNELILRVKGGKKFLTNGSLPGGNGGNGRIYNVLDYEDRVAKIVTDKNIKSNSIKRFEFEIETMRELSKKTTKVPHFYCSGKVENRNALFYIMEKLVSWREYKKPLNYGDALYLSISLAEAIEELHKNEYAHRDIKPKNVLLRLNSSDSEIVLCDLGLMISDSRDGFETKVSEAIGSNGFRPPELVYHNKNLTTEDYFKSDTYQFVKTVYCFLADKDFGFDDRIYSIGADQEIKELEKYSSIENIYNMVELGINPEYSKRPSVNDCKKILEEAFKNCMMNNYDSDLTKKREIRRLNDKFTKLGNSCANNLDSIKGFLENFFKSGSAFNDASTGDWTITSIIYSNDVCIDDAKNTIDKKNQSKSKKYRFCAIRVKKFDEEKILKLLIWRVMIDIDIDSKKSIRVQTKIVNEDGYHLSDVINELTVLKFAGDVSVSTNEYNLDT